MMKLVTFLIVAGVILGAIFRDDIERTFAKSGDQNRSGVVKSMGNMGSAASGSIGSALGD